MVSFVLSGMLFVLRWIKSMGLPVKPYYNSHKRLIVSAQKKQNWILFVVIILMLVLDVLLSPKPFGRSMAIGACLSYVMQLVFTLVSYWRDERLYGQNRYNLLVQDMYVAVLMKWIVGLTGFALIFLFLKSLNFLALLLGFIGMQFLIITVLMTSK